MEQQQIEIPNQGPTPTGSLGSQVPQKGEESSQGQPPNRSLRDTIENAAKESAKLQEAKANPPEPKAEPKAKEAAPKEDRTRSEDGKFQSQNPKVAEAPAKAADVPAQAAETSQSEGRVTRYEAPARFNDQGKAEWAKAPESVQAEVHRALKNMEEGYTKHKEGSERWESVREFDEIARKNGGDLKSTLGQLKAIEDAFDRGPVEGMNAVAQRMGVNLNALAAHIMGQQPNQQVAQAHQRIQELEAKIKEFEAEREAPNIVNEFFSKNEDAKEYTDKIAFLLKTGKADTLEDAFEFVKMFAPASSASAMPASSAPANNQSSSAVVDATPAAPNPAGQKSITGAPSPNADTIKSGAPSKSIRAAIEKAAARLG
jgi:hypothetical protein